MTFELVKVGGSCIAKDVDAVVKTVDDVAGPLLIVHGYSAAVRRILADALVERRPFVSASGVHSHFTGEPELYASLLAASVEGERLAGAFERRGRRARAVLGHHGLLEGERKRSVRYYEGNVLRVQRNDLSGRVTRVALAAVEAELATTDVLVVGAMLHDAEVGPVVCDADAVAAAVALAARLDGYVVLSDVEGFMLDGKLVRDVSASSIVDLASHAHGGMGKKLRSISTALKGGVSEVYLRSGLLPRSSKEGGTRFHADHRGADQQ